MSVISSFFLSPIYFSVIFFRFVFWVKMSVTYTNCVCDIIRSERESVDLIRELDIFHLLLVARDAAPIADTAHRAPRARVCKSNLHLRIFIMHFNMDQRLEIH